MFPKNKSGSIACVVIGSLLLCSGGILAIFWPAIFNEIVAHNLQLRPGGASFLIWKDTPVPMYIEFYFFNWTNSEDILKKGVKPRFQEIGPYRFTEVKEKTDIVWNDNYTISFMQERRWYYDPENSNGSLSDNLTTINVIAMSAAYVSRDWNYFLVMPLNQILKSHSISITHTVGEFLFEGFDDPLINMGKIGSVFAQGVQVPFDKFGWFYTRNGSSEYDGEFNMGTGADDMSQFGVLHQWKHSNWTDYYPDTCGKVKGSAGELFPPLRTKNDALEIYSPDICRSLKFDYTEEVKVEEITGFRYTAGLSNVDNGSVDPANSCYCSGECVPSGLVNVSTCRYGSPAFVSYPHFYEADPYYLDLVDGMNPDKDKHQFYISVEPTTGIPLDVSARLQINILIQPYRYISLFANLPKTFFPMMWFQNRATVPPEMASSLKNLLLLSRLGFAAALVLLSVGIACMVSVLLIRYKDHFKQNKKRVDKSGNSEVISPLMVRTKEPTLATSVYFDARSENKMNESPYSLKIGKDRRGPLHHD